MIAYLRGTVLVKQAGQIILETGGIGYELAVPLSVLERVHEGQEAALFVHHAVRDDGHYLYGFHTLEQRSWFRELIRVSGIGPKIALLILSGFDGEMLAQIVRAQDSAALVKLPGVGKKTAERLLVELKGKFNGVKNNDFFMQVDYWPSFSMEAIATTEPSNEAVAALIALGYKPVDAEKMVKKVSKPELSSEQLIREALKAAL